MIPAGHLPIDQAPATALRMCAIYERPSDYPKLCVLRHWAAVPGQMYVDPESTLANTVAELRAFVPKGWRKLPRQLFEDHAIAEVWCE